MFNTKFSTILFFNQMEEWNNGLTMFVDIPFRIQIDPVLTKSPHSKLWALVSSLLKLEIKVKSITLLHLSV